MGYVRSGKERMYKKTTSVLTTAVSESSLENGMVPCSWPVPPVSCPSERTAGEAQATAERASELQDDTNATFLPRTTSLPLVLTFIVTMVVILRTLIGREEGK